VEPAQTPTIPSPASSISLTDRVRAFLDRPLFLSLATVDPDGAPRQAVIWYRLEADGRILVNSRQGRRWPANLLRDGRVSLAITDSEDGYSWVGLTGHVDEVVDEHDAALADIVALAWLYHPEGPDPADLDGFASSPRITFRIALDGVHDHLED
jgi:PPOX class probable F420-dependent enzyme